LYHSSLNIPLLPSFLPFSRNETHRLHRIPLSLYLYLYLYLYLSLPFSFGSRKSRRKNKKRQLTNAA
jgi:hypothetical protein